MKNKEKENFICPFPWLTPCITTSGHFRICPVSQSSESKGVITDGGAPIHVMSSGGISKARNSQTLRDLRVAMIEGGDVSKICYRCIDEEKVGLKSRRLLEIDRHPDFNESFIREFTRSDGSLLEEAPVQSVVIRVGNKCNLQCRMCGPNSSSAWYSDWNKLKSSKFKDDFDQLKIVESADGHCHLEVDIYDWANSENLNSIFSDIASQLKRIHFSGGEPLLTKGHLSVLDFLVRSGNASSIGLDYNSNLTVVPDQVLRLWRHFSDVQIGASIDGPPDINDYIRYPIKTNLFVKNIQKIYSTCSNVKIWASMTVQIYNVHVLEETRAYLDSLEIPGFDGQLSWHILRAPKELSIYSLPKAVKERIAAKYQSGEFKSISESLLNINHPEMMAEFCSYTHKLDQLRGQDVSRLTALFSEIRPYWSIHERT